MVCGVIQYALFRKQELAGDMWNIAVTGLIFGMSLFLIDENHVYTYANICGNGISFASGGFRTILVILTAGIWFVTTIFSNEISQRQKTKKDTGCFCF